MPHSIVSIRGTKVVMVTDNHDLLFRVHEPCYEGGTLFEGYGVALAFNSADKVTRIGVP